jgi:multidrug efflux pump subunit AcrB
MSVFATILDKRRLILVSAAAVSLLGIVAVITMPRQEDARIGDYWGLIVTPFPGADAEKVERLVVDPIEEYLAEVEEINEVKSTIRSGVAITQVELRTPLDDVDAVWDEVRRSLKKAKREFPESAGDPVLDERLQDQESVVLAIGGSPDPLVLADAADALKKEFLSLPTVARVKLIADPGEQITVEFDDSPARRLGLDPRLLAGRLRARNSTIPGGSIRLGGKKLILRLNDEFESVEEIARTPILLPSGAAVPLAELARVRKGPLEPASEKMRFNLERVVGLGIIPRQGINVVAFGDEVRTKLTEMRKRFKDLEIREVIFQPARVRARLINLAGSLMLSVIVVGVVLLLFMGIRLGLVVASIVPLVALSSLAIYHMGGGVLHQISIAAFVIALGMLVDNAIVVAESVQTRIDERASPREASAAAVKELAVPLAAATGTTLAAFLPMLLAKSTTADFTRALPIIIMATLTVSYVFAVSVTPVLSAVFLRPSSGAGVSALGRIAESTAGLARRRYRWILAGAALLVVVSVAAAGWVDRRFFPMSDRNQFLVELRLPEGAHLDEIDAAAARLETALSRRGDVVSVTGLVGRSVPQFYYNVPRLPQSPHLAQLIVTAKDRSAVNSIVAWTRDFAGGSLAGVEVVARKLQQGPPLLAPFEVRVIGWDLGALRKSSELVLARLAAIPDAVDARHDMSLGVPTIRFTIDDASAARHGLSRSDVALAVQGRTRGLFVGNYRGGEDPVPILVRSKAGERFLSRDLDSLDVAPRGGKPVPLGRLARSRVEWLPAVLHHRNRKRVTTVSSQIAEGASYSRIMDRLAPELRSVEFPKGISLEYGGEAERSDEANRALFNALPIGLTVLVLILVAEFNSFRRVGIIMATVPLAATGVIPGLILSGRPFGFQALLGVFALAGVVVNNAIVLVDLIDNLRSGGAHIAEAVAQAVRVRTRPILLTTVTTVCGLLPLAFSGSNLWPPLAWAMISGLSASTGLTLLVVPSLYLILFRDKEPKPA